MSMIEKIFGKTEEVFRPIAEMKQASSVQLQARMRGANAQQLETPKIYTINDFDHDAHTMKSLYPVLAYEISATEALVDEIIFDNLDDHGAQDRAAKIGAELLAIIREHDR